MRMGIVIMAALRIGQRATSIPEENAVAVQCVSMLTAGLGGMLKAATTTNNHKGILQSATLPDSVL